MTFSEDVFFNQLRISEGFLREHAAAIREKLDLAAAEFNQQPGGNFAVNMCLHAASSVILSNPEYLDEALRLLRNKPGLDRQDATKLLTVIALYCLILWDDRRAAAEAETAETKEARKQASDYRARLTKLHRGLRKLGWMVGEDAMRIAGIDQRVAEASDARG